MSKSSGGGGGGRDVRIMVGENRMGVVFAANGFFTAVLLIVGTVKFIRVIVFASGSGGNVILR